MSDKENKGIDIQAIRREAAQRAYGLVSDVSIKQVVSNAENSPKFEHWAKQSNWTIQEASCLLIEIEPESETAKYCWQQYQDSEKYKIAPKKDLILQKYIDIISTLMRDADNSLTTKIHKNNSPEKYLRWAKEKDFTIPNELAYFVAQYHLFPKAREQKKTAKSVLEEISEIHEHLTLLVEVTGNVVTKPTIAVENAVNEISKAWSGSFIGYHANVYYQNITPPPTKAVFNPEWGLMSSQPSTGTVGDWQKFDADIIKQHIYKIANNPDFHCTKQISQKMKEMFEHYKNEVFAILKIENSNYNDSHLSDIILDIKALTIQSEADVRGSLTPKDWDVMTRDSIASNQGFCFPPHLEVLAEMYTLKQPLEKSRDLTALLCKAKLYLSRLQLKQPTIDKTTNSNDVVQSKNQNDNTDANKYTTKYITLMQQAIVELKIEKNNQPTIQVLKDWFKEQDNLLTHREISSLATFTRLPEMKKGGFHRADKTKSDTLKKSRKP